MPEGLRDITPDPGLRDIAVDPNPGTTKVGQPPPRDTGDMLARSVKQAKTIGAPPPWWMPSKGTQQTLGGMAGGMAAGATVSPYVAGIPVVGPALAAAAPIVGAAAGGAGVAFGQGEDASEAAKEQAMYEAFGQYIGGPLIKTVGKRLLGSSVGRAAAEGLTAAKQGAVDTFNSASQGIANSRVGKMALSVFQGPAKHSLDALGDQVEQTAKTGPPVDFRPVKDSLQSMWKARTPSTLVEGEEPEGAGFVKNAMAVKAGGGASAGEHQNYLNALKAAGIDLEPSHPLPGVLKNIADAPDTVSFEDAHKYKRLLDDATNWQSPAKGQIKQITKGARGAVREAMSGHKPYDDATAAYQTAVPLFRTGYVAQVNKVATENPESLVKGIKADQPTKLKMLWDVLDTHAKQGGDPAAGQDAKSAIRTAWTRKNLVQPGVENFSASLKKMDPEFVQHMYGDKEGRELINNLGEISGAYETAVQKEEALSKSSLMKQSNNTSAARNVAKIAMHPGGAFTPIYLASLATSKGAKMADLVTWASHSPQATQILVKAMQGPKPGLAVSNLMRVMGTVAAHGDEEENAGVGTPPPQARSNVGAPPP